MDVQRERSLGPESKRRPKRLRCLWLVALLVACQPPASPEPSPGPPRDPLLSVTARLLPMPMEDEAPSVRALPTPPLVEGLTFGRETHRVATLATANTRMSWSVNLPPRARLRFGYAVGVADEVRTGGEVLFRVELQQAGRSQDIFSERVSVASPKAPLPVVELELDGSPGPAEIVFSTSRAATDEGPTDLVTHWSNPLLLGENGGAVRVPNIVVICVDTLRTDRLAAFGGIRSAMPNLDMRLAAAAVFARAYANSSWSLPSMASILTGRVPGEHHAGRRFLLGESSAPFDYNAKPTHGGIELVLNHKSYRFQMLHPSIPTLQEVLGRAGYMTAAIHNNGYINYPTRVLKGADHSHHYHQRDAEVGTTRALDWVQAQHDRRFFLFLHYIDPHQWPVHIADELKGQSLVQLDETERDQVLATYDRLVEHTDREIERFLSGLDDLGLARDTIVVLLADHGERFMEKGVVGSHGGSFYESVIKVPLALWGPGIEPRRRNDLVSLVDVVPTLLDLVELEAPEGISGSSLRSMLAGAPESNRRVFSEFVLWSPDDLYAVLEGDWKYILSSSASDSALYDVVADPGETENLIDIRREQAARLRRVLSRHIREGRTAFQRLEYEATQIDEGTLESLRALGYLQ